MKKSKWSFLIYPDVKFYKELACIAVPIAIQGLITVGVNLADTLMIGALGERQLSSAALATQYMNLFHSFCMGLSMGASVLASRFWGMGELESLKKMIALMYRLCLMLVIFFSLTTLFLPEQIMQMYTAETDIIVYGMEYLKYCTWGYFFYGLSLTTTIILRSIKQVKIPLLVSIITFFLNIVMNYVLMYGKLGFPAMGIGGAALSTLLIRILEFIIICGYLLMVEQVLKFRLKDCFGKTKGVLREYLRIGFPVLVSDVMLALGGNVVMMIVGRMGAVFVAANAITAIVERISSILIAGISQGSAVITGNTMGRGEAENVQRQGWAFLGIGVMLGLVSAVVILIISGSMISIYGLTEETADITRQLLYAMSLIVIFTSTNHILTKGTLRGGGDTKALMIADNVFLWFVSIPLGFIGSMVFHLPGFWIYICLKIENPIKSIWCVFRLKSRKWIKEINVLAR